MRAVHKALVCRALIFLCLLFCLNTYVVAQMHPDDPIVHVNDSSVFHFLDSNVTAMPIAFEQLATDNAFDSMTMPGKWELNVYDESAGKMMKFDIPETARYSIWKHTEPGAVRNVVMFSGLGNSWIVNDGPGKWKLREDVHMSTIMGCNIYVVNVMGFGQSAPYSQAFLRFMMAEGDGPSGTCRSNSAASITYGDDPETVMTNPVVVAKFMVDGIIRQILGPEDTLFSIVAFGAGNIFALHMADLVPVERFISIAPVLGKQHHPAVSLNAFGERPTHLRVFSMFYSAFDVATRGEGFTNLDETFAHAFPSATSKKYIFGTENLKSNECREPHIQECPSHWIFRDKAPGFPPSDLAPLIGDLLVAELMRDT